MHRTMTDDEEGETMTETSGGRRGRWDAVLDYALVLAIIYNSNSMWALVPDQFALSCFVLAAVALCYYVVHVVRGRTRLRGSLVPMAVIMLCTVAGQALLAAVHRDGSFLDGIWFQYALILPLLTGCILVQGRDSFRSSFLPRLVILSALFAGVGTVLWFLSSFLGLPAPFTQHLTWTSGGEVGSYFGLYYNVQDMLWGDGKIWRNSSIFNEPPCAAAFYAIVLAADLYLVPGKRTARRWWCDAALVAALVTSTSTSAYLYLIILALPFAAGRLYRAFLHRGKRFAVGMLAGLGTVCVVVGAIIVIHKIATSGSGQTHLIDYVVGMRLWLQHPWFGFGMEADGQIWWYYMIYYRGGLGYTSGLFFMLIHGGVLLALYALVPWAMLLLASRDWRQMWVAALIVFMFVTAAVQNFALLLLMFAYGYACLAWRLRQRARARARATITEETTGKEAVHVAVQ